MELDEGRLSRSYQLPGTLVIKVQTGSPAQKLGLKGLSWTRRGLVLGDFVLAIKKPCPNAESIYQHLDDFKSENSHTTGAARSRYPARQREVKLN